MEKAALITLDGLTVENVIIADAAHAATIRASGRILRTLLPTDSASPGDSYTVGSDTFAPAPPDPVVTGSMKQQALRRIARLKNTINAILDDSLRAQCIAANTRAEVAVVVYRLSALDDPE